MPFASTELNKGIVGETEKTIRDIIRRGNAYPYLLCCVAIDEIDAIVPKRDGDQKNSKGVESLTQFLTLIGGVDDVKNVVNVGAPVDQRGAVIESLLTTKSSGSNLLNAIIYILINFD